MRRLAARVESLERHRAARGCCPHLPPLVVHENDWRPAAKPRQEPPCPCGRPRVRVVVRYVADWGTRYREPDDSA